MAGGDRYHDENGVLLNKLGITDAQKLSDVEYFITAGRARSWELTPHPELKFDLDRQKAIHKHLFDPLYAWAGKTRTTPLSKNLPGTKLKGIFADPEQVEPGWKELSGRIDAFLADKTSGIADKKPFLLDVYVKANNAHPFAEGNGRSLQVFMRDLAKEQGIDIDYSKVSKEDWNRASAMSGSIARRFESDLIHVPSDREPLRKVFEQLTSPSLGFEKGPKQPFVMTPAQQQTFYATQPETKPQSPRAIAFAELSPAEAIARHPELKPVIVAWNYAQQILQARHPQGSHVLQTNLEQARSEVIRRLNSDDKIIAPERSQPPPGRPR